MKSTELKETQTNARNGCFEVLKVSRNMQKVNNPIEFPLIYNFKSHILKFSNLQILHLQTHLIVHVENIMTRPVNCI